jgi:hypothetical protein
VHGYVNRRGVYMLNVELKEIVENLNADASVCTTSEAQVAVVRKYLANLREFCEKMRRIKFGQVVIIDQREYILCRFDGAGRLFSLEDGNIWTNNRKLPVHMDLKARDEIFYVTYGELDTYIEYEWKLK